MDTATDREREIANVICNIDKLDDAGARAILRNLASDDAAFSEAQCSHIARVINGTLNKKPQETVNATLSCASGFDAAVNWEKQFASASHPTIVSEFVRKNQNSVPNRVQIHAPSLEQPDQSSVQEIGDGEAVRLLEPGDAVGNGNLPNIINKGHMTIHFHNQLPSFDTSSLALVSKKRERDEEEMQYAQALDAIMVTDQLEAEVLSSSHPSKRARLQETSTEKKTTETRNAHAATEVGKPSLAQDVKETPPYGVICRNCGAHFTRARNVRQKDGNLPCRHHTGKLVPYPAGLKRERRSGTEVFFEAWDCCGKDPGDRGCVFTKHTT
ncbi:hypothetical protein VPNG_09837 [Cytospora leucostoma]|uniref:Uncharacterized protein n=1 Tax=Cytospora leucostoma TaxID=1230097 RepID=A0A423VIP5_9PEZI|nr:hypothetical protein VPNG_09837 [Cytospora leucostoma]